MSLSLSLSIIAAAVGLISAVVSLWIGEKRSSKKSPQRANALPKPVSERLWKYIPTLGLDILFLAAWIGIQILVTWIVGTSLGDVFPIKYLPWLFGGITIVPILVYLYRDILIVYNDATRMFRPGTSIIFSVKTLPKGRVEILESTQLKGAIVGSLDLIRNPQYLSKEMEDDVLADPEMKALAEHFGLL